MGPTGDAIKHLEAAAAAPAGGRAQPSERATTRSFLAPPSSRGARAHHLQLETRARSRFIATHLSLPAHPPARRLLLNRLAERAHLKLLQSVPPPACGPPEFIDTRLEASALTRIEPLDHELAHLARPPARLKRFLCREGAAPACSTFGASGPPGGRVFEEKFATSKCLEGAGAK